MSIAETVFEYEDAQVRLNVLDGCIVFNKGVFLKKKYLTHCSDLC